MKPYHESARGQLYCGDCLEVMPELKQGFDICFTDPPYGIGEAAGKNKSRSSKTIATDYGNLLWDNKIPDKVIFDLIFKLSDNQIIFGGNYFIEYLKNSSCWIVWDKDNTGNFADAELIYTSFKTAVRIIKFRWNGMLQQDMKYKEKRFHPTQKPVQLCENILRKYSKTGQSIIDPFAGVGSILISAEKLGHRWAGIEREEQYCEIAAKRIEEVANQMSY